MRRFGDPIGEVAAWVTGDPNGEVTAPAGALAVDIKTGTLYQCSGGSTWTTFTSGGSVVTTGRFLGRQRFTANGTYTPTTGTRRVKVRMVGGGGGSGGVSAHATEYTQSGGGCSGGYAEANIFASGGITGGAVTIGAAGTAGDNTPSAGGAGGATSVVIQGVTYTVPGGLGGGGGNGGAGIGIADGGQPNGAPPSGVDVYVVGYGQGVANRVVKGANVIASGGWGGRTPFGGPANPGQRMSGTTQTPGNAPGDSYGHGASGTTGDNSAGAGKPGGAGLVIIDEWT